jgi:hypothetical protein
MPFRLPAPAYATRFRWMWGTIPASGARFRCNRKSAPLPSGILPHIATERCPTSNGISAPLRLESAFEPDGSVPPDFLVQKTIAIEVRRLNQHWTSPGGDEIPLEAVEVPVAKKLTELLDSFGAPCRQ